jgi:hypothetical protein
MYYNYSITETALYGSNAKQSFVLSLHDAKRKIDTAVSLSLFVSLSTVQCMGFFLLVTEGRWQPGRGRYMRSRARVALRQRPQIAEQNLLVVAVLGEEHYGRGVADFRDRHHVKILILKSNLISIIIHTKSVNTVIF